MTLHHIAAEYVLGIRRYFIILGHWEIKSSSSPRSAAQLRQVTTQHRQAIGRVSIYLSLTTKCPLPRELSRLFPDLSLRARSRSRCRLMLLLNQRALLAARPTILPGFSWSIILVSIESRSLCRILPSTRPLAAGVERGDY